MNYEILKGQCQFLMGISRPEQLTEWLTQNPNLLGLAFVGRSNVGKSSLINSLFGKGIARTSKTPGRTREINVFSFEIGEKGEALDEIPPLYFFDLPGYGHAKVSRQMADNWVELMETFFQNVSPNVRMMNLQDARHPEQQSDLDFQKFLKNYNFETNLIFNKIDKLKKQSERAQLEKRKIKIFEDYTWVQEIHFISAEQRIGITELELSILNFLMGHL